MARKCKPFRHSKVSLRLATLGSELAARLFFGRRCVHIRDCGIEEGDNTFRRSSLGLAFTTTVILVSAVQADATKYTGADGDPANGCTGWADARPGLQVTLGLAVNGDQIWFAVVAHIHHDDVVSRRIRCAEIQQLLVTRRRIER